VYVAVDGKLSDAWGQAPDVIEADCSEITSKAHSNPTTTEEGDEAIAAILPAVEAAIGELPYAVNAVDLIRLG